MENDFTDRYEALGMPYPDRETMCKGECEGVGVYPVKPADDPTATDEERHRWQVAHDEAERSGHDNLDTCDGWHFITCPDCEGSGKAAA
jgi:hypothetical protein